MRSRSCERYSHDGLFVPVSWVSCLRCSRVKVNWQRGGGDANVRYYSPRATCATPPLLNKQLTTSLRLCGSPYYFPPSPSTTLRCPLRSTPFSLDILPLSAQRLSPYSGTLSPSQMSARKFLTTTLRELDFTIRRPSPQEQQRPFGGEGRDRLDVSQVRLVHTGTFSKCYNST